MTALFFRLLGMGLTGSVVILAVCLLRLVLRRAPKAASYALWAPVLIRLLCPFALSSPVALLPEGVGDLPALEWRQQLSGGLRSQAVPGIEAGIPEAAGDAAPAEPETQRGFDAALALSLVWAAGALGMALRGAVGYLRLRRRLALRRRLRDNIYIADDIGSPFAAGLFRPRIYLPCGLDGREQELVIMHEQHHIRRLDPLWRLLAYAALCLHWYNPLVWLAFSLSGRDMEASCDEAVLRRMGGEVRADYAAALLKFSGGGRGAALTSPSFGEGDAGRRIRGLASWKKPALWLSAAAAALCILAALLLLTDRTAAGLTRLRAVSGENSVRLLSCAEDASPEELRDGLEWLEIAQQADALPFAILDGGKERYGFYEVYDAESLEALEFLHPSGLAPQAYIFQNAEPGGRYIVTLTLEEGRYAFGAQLTASGDGELLLLAAFYNMVHEPYKLATDWVLAQDGADGLLGVVQYDDGTGAPWRTAYVLEDGSAYAAVQLWPGGYVAGQLEYLGGGVVRNLIKAADGTVYECLMRGSPGEGGYGIKAECSPLPQA